MQTPTNKTNIGILNVTINYFTWETTGLRPYWLVKIPTTDKIRAALGMGYFECMVLEGVSEVSEKDAVKDAVSQLQELNLTGMVRIMKRNKV